MLLYKVDRSDITLRESKRLDSDYDETNNQNLKQLKFSGFNIEMRELFWHLALTDYF